MQYIPKLTDKEIEENHKHFSERVSLYKKRDLDFLRSREFILEKAKSLKGSILEIGTGTGHTTLSLAKAGYKLSSIDKDKEALKTTALNLAYPECRNILRASSGSRRDSKEENFIRDENLLSRVSFYEMDGESLTFTNNSFRNVVIVNLFHHINGVDKMLSEVDRILATHGKLILADFNERGMKIVGSVHKQEGRIHEDSGVSKDYIYSYFHSLGYEIRSYEDRCHWILIAEKKIQQ